MGEQTTAGAVQELTRTSALTWFTHRVLVPDERQLAPITSAFLLFGSFWGGWAVTAADFERSLRIGNGAFGALLSLSLLGGAAGNAVGGPAAERWGTARVLAVALATWGSLLVVGAFLHGAVLLALALAAVVCTAGLVDVVMNVAASATLSPTPGYLVRFHGRFNVGAAVGAACAGALLGGGYGWRPVWVVGGLLALCLAVWSRRSPLPASDSGEAVRLTGAVAVLRREGLVVLAIAFAIAAMVEGGIELWGVLFLRTRLHSGLLVGAGGAVFAYSVAATARFTLGEKVGRRGPSTGIAVGAGVAAAGATLMAASTTPELAAAGLIAAAGGISMCWPLFVARAASGRDRPGAGVGAMSAVGYLGLVAGPVLVGSVSEGLSLRAGLGFLAAAAGFVAVIPRFLRRR